MCSCVCDCVIDTCSNCFSNFFIIQVWVHDCVQYFIGPGVLLEDCLQHISYMIILCYVVFYSTWYPYRLQLCNFQTLVINHSWRIVGLRSHNITSASPQVTVGICRHRRVFALIIGDIIASYRCSVSKSPRVSSVILILNHLYWKDIKRLFSFI